jgi:membrane protein CcdC involved in cytochrome C biogenesis
MNELERWANFYLLMSTAVATLIGLLFVVIALAAERRHGDPAKILIYLTPTVIYFASILFLAALLIFPNHSRLTSTLCICLVGVVGLIYSGISLIGGGVRKSYYERSDLIYYAIIPSAAYGLLVLGGVLFLHAPQSGLTLVPAGMLSLLAIAIRNSWAIAIDVVSTPPGRDNSK